MLLIDKEFWHIKLDIIYLGFNVLITTGKD